MSFYTVYMFSGILLVVPLFKIITALGIYDTEMALIITMVTQTLHRRYAEKLLRHHPR